MKLIFSKGFPAGSVVKNLPDNAGDAGLIPGLGRSLGKEAATHSSILTWKIPWTRSSVGYSPWGHKGVRHNLATKQQQYSLKYVLENSVISLNCAQYLYDRKGSIVSIFQLKK